QPLAYQQPSPDRSVESSPRRPEPQGAAESQSIMSFAAQPASIATAAQGVSRVTKREVPALSIEETVKRGRELLAAGEISLGRLVLERAVSAGSADAALSLGASYDPNILNTQKSPSSPASQPIRLAPSPPASRSPLISTRASSTERASGDSQSSRGIE